MEIRRFSASDTRTAMRRVRAEMGADAVILSTRPVEGGVELVSASNYDPELLADFAPSGNASNDTRESRDTPTESVPDPDDVQRQLNATVRDLRTLLEREARRQPVPATVAQTPQHAACATQLADAGFSANAVRRLLARLPEATDFVLSPRQLAAALLQTIGNDPLSVLDAGGALAVVGPTGVGKTTTIAKLAVRLATRASTDDIALVSTDSCRLGAHYQLQSLGRLLAIPVFEVDEPAELGELLPVLSNRRWVLIDTAGSGDTAARAVTLQRLFAQRRQTLHILLALAGNAQPSFNEAVLARHCSALAPTIALTKADECITLGPALSTLIKHGRPLALTSTGPSIPDDLTLGDEVLALLARRALGRNSLHRSASPTAEIAHERR